MTLAMDSKPNSTLNQARIRLDEAKKAFGGNRSPDERSKATRDMNRARTALREVAYYMRERRYTPQRKELASFETTVCGVPCGVVVDHYVPGKPWVQHNFPNSGPGDCDPPQHPECEWHLIDRKGYAAKWLEERMSKFDEERITAMVLGV